MNLKLAASWAAVMFLYAYGDIFAYFRPGFIEDVMAGEVFAFEINQLFLLAISVYVAIPAAMVSAVLGAEARAQSLGEHRPRRRLRRNHLLSTIGEDYAYYVFLSIVEAAFAALIVWNAWKWPRQAIGSDSS